MKNLRRVLIIFFIISITAAAAFAGPALQRDFTLTQPDGESFSAMKRGDEFMNWYETAQGYAVLKDGESGYWVFALRTAAGAEPAECEADGIREQQEDLYGFWRAAVYPLWRQRTAGIVRVGPYAAF